MRLFVQEFSHIFQLNYFSPVTRDMQDASFIITLFLEALLCLENTRAFKELHISKAIYQQHANLHIRSIYQQVVYTTMDA
jgi:hypothetical protein